MLTDQQVQDIVRQNRPKLKSYNNPNSGSSILRSKTYATPDEFLASINGNSESNEESPGFLSNVGKDIFQRVQSVKDTMSDATAGKINPIEAGVQNIGAVAGGVNDVLGEGMKSAKPLADIASKLNPISSSLDGIKGLIPDSVKQMFHPAVQVGVDALHQGMDAYQNWASQNPRAAKDLGSVVNIASLFPIGKGASLSKNAVEDVAGSAVKGITEKMAVTGEKKEFSSALKAVKQETKYMTPTEKEAAKKVSGGLLKKAEPVVTEEDKRLASKFKENLKSGSNIDKENSMKNYLTDKTKEMEDYLTSQKIPLDKTKLQNRIKSSLDEVFPEGVKETTKKEVIDTLMSKIEGDDLAAAWKGRSKFDKAVENIFGQDGLSAAGDIKKAARDATNSFIEEEIPDSLYKVKLKDMSDAFRVLDRISPKAAKDLGKSGIQRAVDVVKKHPVITTGATAYGAYQFGKRGF